jgi:lipoprotein Spr
MRTDYEAAARRLVGVRFRPQGRSSEGLDCVGAVLATYGIDAAVVRRDYRMRGDHAGEIRERLNIHFRRVAPSQMRSGDLLHLLVAADRHHFAIRTGRGFVHAHAQLGRIVETPGEPEWPLLGAYRRRRKGT